MCRCIYQVVRCVARKKKCTEHSVIYANEIMPISASCISETMQLISTKFIVCSTCTYTTSHTKFKRNCAIKFTRYSFLKII